MDESKLEPTFSMPGPGGSLGKCALCGDPFFYEVLMGETIATMKCSWFPEKTLPLHHKCADKLEHIKVATDLPPGPLRTAWDRHQSTEAQHG